MVWPGTGTGPNVFLAKFYAWAYQSWLVYRRAGSNKAQIGLVANSGSTNLSLTGALRIPHKNQTKLLNNRDNVPQMTWSIAFAWGVELGGHPLGLQLVWPLTPWKPTEFMWPLLIRREPQLVIAAGLGFQFAMNCLRPHHENGIFICLFVCSWI